jgi:hypothetical protein
MFRRRRFPIDGQWHSWIPVNNDLDCGNIWSLANDPVGPIFPEPRLRNSRVWPTDNGHTRTVGNKDWKSTDVAALAVDGRNCHLFAGTHFVMVRKMGCFAARTTLIQARNRKAAQPLT